MENVNISFILNGKKCEAAVKPHETLADMLRERFYLTGTKIGCGEGDCGACTVIMNGKTIKSCIVLAVKADKTEIITIEALGSYDKMHPIQQAFVEVGAIQCGFCTPGMIMSAKALLDSNPNPTEEDIKKAISGNVCRCTGYMKIEEAIKKAAAAYSPGKIAQFAAGGEGYV